MLPSFLMMPPLSCALFGFVWREMMFTPSTVILCFAGKQANTLPCLPLSLPAITTTVSPLRTFRLP